MESKKTTETRPWGSFTVIDAGTGYKVKRIFVKAGHRLSLQRHERREEHWSIVSGQGVLTFEEPTGSMTHLKDSKLLETTVGPGFQVKILKGARHRIEAIEDLVFIEVQLGECDEDDIERFEDDYGRTNQTK